MMKEASSMTPKQDPGRAGEQGSALIIATLVSVILALLGLSYLMMAQTESTIAENERNSATAMYVAEAGTRLAVNWFNDPSSTGYLVPTSAQVDRTLRVFDHDANPGTARVQAVAGDPRPAVSVGPGEHLHRGRDRFRWRVPQRRAGSGGERRAPGDHQRGPVPELSKSGPAGPNHTD